MDEIDLIAETELDPEIQFSNPVSPNALAPRAVCLTGATGFLGAYLLHDVLTKTEAVAYCLVRADNDASAYGRIVKNLSSYDLWRDEFAGRVRAIPIRDLSDLHFGLGADEYRELADSTDVIYHSAGSLNMAFPYARLKATNVTGTVEVLRLAGAVQTKPVHFLSSMVVFFTDAHTNDELLRESDAPRVHTSLKGGYGKSKWVADRLVAAAQQRGLPASIYRPVRTMGSASTGALNDLSDIFPLLVKACILLGKCPHFDVKVTMVPVDFVTGAMVHLACRQDSWGRAFHFFHPAPVEWDRLMDILRNLGYPLDQVSYGDWWSELKRRVSSAEDPVELRKFFSTALLALTAPHFLFYKRPPLDASNLTEGIKGTGLTYPGIDESLMGTYLSYWQKIGYVPAPQVQELNAHPVHEANECAYAARV